MDLSHLVSLRVLVAPTGLASCFLPAPNGDSSQFLNSNEKQIKLLRLTSRFEDSSNFKSCTIVEVSRRIASRIVNIADYRALIRTLVAESYVNSSSLHVSFFLLSLSSLSQFMSSSAKNTHPANPKSRTVVTPH
jgi:hypothetical protein